jgi:hypothetical protein
MGEAQDEYGLTGVEQPACTPQGGDPTPTDRACAGIGSCHGRQLYAMAIGSGHSKQ